MCHDTLVEIQFICISAELEITKCFSKLKTLDLSYGSVDLSFFQFGKWFPKMENLIINSISNVDTLNPRQGIPLLKNFFVVFHEKFSNQQLLRVSKLNKFINCNPQLNEICLKLSDINNDPVFRGKKIAFDDVNIPIQLTSVKLEMVYSNGQYSESLSQLMIPQQGIERLELTTNRLNDQICDFIKSCSSVKTMKVIVDFTRICYQADEFFKGIAWMESAKHEQLTEYVMCCHHQI